MSIVVTGSIAYDYIMSFPGYFKDHILPDKIEFLSVSFLVDSMRRQRGGCAGNIAYSLALLGVRPRIMGTVGQDFEDYRRFLEEKGVDTSGIVAFPDEFTASFFVSTDLASNQIASFYTGAMSRAATLSFRKQPLHDIELVVISPNDPGAMIAYARECQELGLAYLYDPSQQIIRLSGQELLDGMKGARLLVVNDYEFEMMKNKTGLSDEALIALTPTVVITRGERGSTIIDEGRTIEIPIAPPACAGEPTGVGDAYRAGLILGLIRGYPWEVAGRISSLAATYALECYGTQSHSFTLSEFTERYRTTFGDTPELQDLIAAAVQSTAK